MADTSSTPGPVPASSTSTSGAMAPDATVDLVSEAEPPAGPSRVSRAPRVSQIDAQELDEGLVGMLSGRLRAAGAVFGVSNACFELHESQDTDLTPACSRIILPPSSSMDLRFTCCSSSSSIAWGSWVQRQRLRAGRPVERRQACGSRACSWSSTMSRVYSRRAG